MDSLSFKGCQEGKVSRGVAAVLTRGVAAVIDKRCGSRY